ncbi:RagB/SusD family nutrient uptake outer membrane protein [Dyadobacter luticola]|uniref:RagB/SusD family nutrient uptake outer membrane protein n=1 Tax=Dyadobacter luticola TaxID=1979387 RepID=A0A5R9L2A1_9BACT|nr:RagB/SusD family nutrient uptake outer membrane protein [Dyadobacter luticola]TLV02528.1 RagB/SusD family nutrient uptake outer membrane protein [Dyadobacter luticola]
MKNLKILALSILFLSGCSDKLLDVKNENTYTDETYFKTQTQFNESILATYAVFSHMGMMSREWYFIFDLLANEAERSSALVGTELQLTDYSFTNNNEDIVGLWASLYRMIFRANLALKVMETWQPGDDSEVALKAQYIAEAHWLRGFAYFNLVTNWGRVPLKMTYDDSKTNSAPRASVEEVWKVVESEFSLAIPDLPVAYPADQLGRATKGAAVGFLGKTYLFQKKYDQAAEQLVKLTAAPYTYALDPKYDHLFGEDNINTPEVIFAVNHTYTTSNTQYYMFGGQEGEDGKTFHTGRAQEYGFNDWENVTISNALVAAHKYNDPATGAAGYIDPRAKYTFYGATSNGGDTQYCDFCAAGPIKYPYDFYSNRYRKYEPYEFQKYTEAPMSGINTHVMRYADVLLMLAEANIEKASPNIPTAIGYINQVRNRPDVMAKNYPTTLTQTAAREAVRRERRIELAGEQVRWFDLNRWGIAKETLNAEHPAGPGQQPFLDKHVLLPIPIAERNSNPAIAADVAGDWN